MTGHVLRVRRAGDMYSVYVSPVLLEVFCSRICTCPQFLYASP